MKKNLTLILSALLLFLILSFNVKLTDAAQGDTSITITNATMSLYADGHDRICFTLYNEEGITIENGPGVRLGSPTATFTMGINGVDYTFTPVSGLSGYIASFGQIPAGSESSAWPVYLKHPTGNEGLGNANYYPADYPGLPKGQVNVLTFHKGSILGKYKFANEFSLIFSADGKNMDFVYNNHEVIYPEGMQISGTYLFDSKIQASEGAKLTITPEIKEGYVFKYLKILNSDSVSVESDLTNNGDGTLTLTMPYYAIEIIPVYEEATYKLNVDGQIKSIKPGDKIGELPKGFWNIDGYSISSESLYFFDSDKTATLETYNLTLIVDGEIYQVINFNGTENIILPPIPYKEGYEIIGWSIDHLVRSDMVAYAIYE